MVCPSIGAQGIGHGAVPDQGRVYVDIAKDNAVFINKISAKGDARHFNTVFGAFLGRDRAHEGAVGQGKVGHDHIKVAFVHGNIGGFANGAAGVVEIG